ncbi:Regulatory protein RecX [bioreactor metagenome]|uniref:Regulatory protein RecX n=1 Tax=bioreactor metagenome TaxID=1076179 RepID=A0A645FY11_9ZZZZ
MKNKTLTYDEALHKSAAYCSLSEHCKSELIEKFNYWEVLPEFREKIIQFLVREKYIDEKRFASAFVKDKFNYNKWGKIRLKIELKAKKIEDGIIEGALSEITEKDYRMMVAKLIQEKEKQLEYRNEYEKKGKLFRYLSGKGFENDIISKTLGINE